MAGPAGKPQSGKILPQFVARLNSAFKGGPIPFFE